MQFSAGGGNTTQIWPSEDGGATRPNLSGVANPCKATQFGCALKWRPWGKLLLLDPWEAVNPGNVLPQVGQWGLGRSKQDRPAKPGTVERSTSCMAHVKAFYTLLGNARLLPSCYVWGSTAPLFTIHQICAAGNMLHCLNACSRLHPPLCPGKCSASLRQKSHRSCSVTAFHRAVQNRHNPAPIYQ